jgi:hypothetical protein
MKVQWTRLVCLAALRRPAFAQARTLQLPHDRPPVLPVVECSPFRLLTVGT